MQITRDVVRRVIRIAYNTAKAKVIVEPSDIYNGSNPLTKQQPKIDTNLMNPWNKYCRMLGTKELKPDHPIFVSDPYHKKTCASVVLWLPKSKFTDVYMF